VKGDTPFPTPHSPSPRVASLQSSPFPGELERVLIISHESTRDTENCSQSFQTFPIFFFLFFVKVQMQPLISSTRAIVSAPTTVWSSMAVPASSQRGIYFFFEFAFFSLTGRSPLFSRVCPPPFPQPRYPAPPEGTVPSARRIGWDQAPCRTSLHFPIFFSLPSPFFVVFEPFRIGPLPFFATDTARDRASSGVIAVAWIVSTSLKSGFVSHWTQHTPSPLCGEARGFPSPFPTTPS